MAKSSEGVYQVLMFLLPHLKEPTKKKKKKIKAKNVQK